jgi:hypothetical protein
MSTLAKVLTGLAALAFVLAVVANFAGAFMQVGAEGFSRASTNLALLALAFMAISRDRGVMAGRGA